MTHRSRVSVAAVLALCCAAACDSNQTVGSRYAKSALVRAAPGGVPVLLQRRRHDRHRHRDIDGRRRLVWFMLLVFVLLFAPVPMRPTL